MALRREVLDAIGGLAPLRDSLADDWALGAAVRGKGLTIGLVARPVDLVVHEPTLASLLAHEIRWGRTIASIGRGSYIASVLTQPVALAVLAALCGGWIQWATLALAVLARGWAVRAEQKALALPATSLHLLVLREALSFVVYLAACCGRSVRWRGERFKIRRDGTLELKKEGHPT
jgi:ceramide glucosyltransferase